MTQTEIIKQYDHDHQIIKITKTDGPPRYYFEDPLNRMKGFESLDQARLYADVYTVVGGFREEHSGKRGCPPATAQSREDIQMSYYIAQNGINAGTSVTWVASTYNRPEQEVRDYVSLIRERAADIRADDDVESI